MEKKTLSLHEKMVLVRSEIPALVKRTYSDEVNYEFTKIDDIFRWLAPAMKNHMVNWGILSEEASKKDSGGNPCYLTYIEKSCQWLYEADLTIRWTNAEAPEETEDVKLHLIGTHEIPEKAKGCAWTYALKYYLQDQLCVDQGAEDPDMRSDKPQYSTSAPPKSSGAKEQDLLSELLDEGFEAVTDRTVFDEQPTRIEREAAEPYIGEMEPDGLAVAGTETVLEAGGALGTSDVSGVVSEEASVCMEDAEGPQRALEDNTLSDVEEDRNAETVSVETGGEGPSPISPYILPGKGDMVKLPAGVRKRERSQKKSDMPGEEAPAPLIPKEETDSLSVQENTADPVTEKTVSAAPAEPEVPNQNDGGISLEEACEIKIKVGIHKGKSLGQLASLGKEGIEMLTWYAENYRGSDEKLKQGARLLLREARKAA